MNHVGPDDLQIRSLVERVAKGGVSEVIMATNPDTEGEATAMWRCFRAVMPIQQRPYREHLHISNLPKRLEAVRAGSIDAPYVIQFELTADELLFSPVRGVSKEIFCGLSTAVGAHDRCG